jgi:hypothetical protein
MAETLFLYVFHLYDDRVKRFFEKAIFDDDRFDFLLICNSKELEFEYPQFKNVSVLRRENIGLDFGGWSEGLVHNDLYKRYETFIFVNSSVVGPFLPTYYQGKWPEIYLDGLKKENIHLFGSTINNAGVGTEVNPWVFTHIQSYIFSMTKETVEYLMETQILSITNYAKDIWDDIFNKEILMSRKIVEKGWNLGCLQTLYQGVDFTFRSKRPEDYPFLFLGDLTFGSDGGKLWEKRELVFIKGNRVKDY